MNLGPTRCWLKEYMRMTKDMKTYPGLIPNLQGQRARETVAFAVVRYYAMNRCHFSHFFFFSRCEPTIDE